jgi:hypothetical protein
MRHYQSILLRGGYLAVGLAVLLPAAMDSGRDFRPAGLTLSAYYLMCRSKYDLMCRGPVRNSGQSPRTSLRHHDTFLRACGHRSTGPVSQVLLAATHGSIDSNAVCTECFGTKP